MTWRPPSRATANAAACRVGSGNASSGPARSQPVSPSGRPRTAASASATLSSGSCERIAVQIRRTSTSCSPAASFAPRATASMTVRRGEAARGVERRGPADLEVADALAGLRLDQLAGDPLESLRVLHQLDRQAKGAEELGLVAAGHRGDQLAPHPLDVPRRVDAPGPGEIERRLDPERAVEMEVELRLRHRREPGASLRGVRRCADAGTAGTAAVPGESALVAEPARDDGTPPDPEGSATTRCYDAARCPGCSTPRHDHPMRRVLLTIVWLLVAAVIAIGGAGLVATMANPPGTASRPELTTDGDEAVRAGPRRRGAGDQRPRRGRRPARRARARRADGAGRLRLRDARRRRSPTARRWPARSRTDPTRSGPQLASSRAPARTRSCSGRRRPGAAGTSRSTPWTRPAASNRRGSGSPPASTTANGLTAC